MTRSLEVVAAKYLSARNGEDRHRATHVTAEHFAVSRATVLRDLNKARAVGLIPEEPANHRPKRLRWVEGGRSWLACAECRTPWPCDSQV